MAALHYWTGTAWAPIASGGGGGTPGPQGEPGKSINVFVQGTQPAAPSVGDHWINTAATQYLNADQMVTFKNLDNVNVTYPTLD